MPIPSPITGVVLAGGLARRLGQQDKGLVRFQGRALVQFAIHALSSVTPHLLINANRNLEQYRAFGFPVIADISPHFDGPLAGIYTALCHTDAEVLLVMPCDSPLFAARHLHKLLDAYQAHTTDVAVATDGTRLHPVFLALNTHLKASLCAYLDSGERKLDRWLAQHHTTVVDFSDEPAIFTNINTWDELAALEPQHG